MTDFPRIDLSGKHALITGGLGTLGSAMAERFKQAGAMVTILDRPDGKPREGYNYLAVDLNDLPGAEKAVKAATPFDILISAATGGAASATGVGRLTRSR